MLTKELEAGIAAALQNKLQQPVSIQGSRQVFGGDINQTFVLQTTAGKLFVKLNEASMGDMFEKESNGLQLLVQSQAIAVPKPVAAGCINGHIFLVMEYIEKGQPAANFWQGSLGMGLQGCIKQRVKALGLKRIII